MTEFNLSDLKVSDRHYLEKDVKEFIKRLKEPKLKFIKMCEDERQDQNILGLIAVTKAELKQIDKLAGEELSK